MKSVSRVLIGLLPMCALCGCWQPGTEVGTRLDGFGANPGIQQVLFASDPLDQAWLAESWEADGAVRIALAYTQPANRRTWFGDESPIASEERAVPVVVNDDPVVTRRLSALERECAGVRVSVMAPQLSGNPLAEITDAENIRAAEVILAAARRERADMLVVFTWDLFERVEQWGEPLAVVSLGIAPTQTPQAKATLYAVIADVRTGSVLDRVEQHDSGWQPANSWNQSGALGKVVQRMKSRLADVLAERVVETLRVQPAQRIR